MLHRVIAGCVAAWISASAQMTVPNGRSTEDLFRGYGCERFQITRKPNLYQERESIFVRWPPRCRLGWTNIWGMCYKPCSQHEPVGQRVPDGGGYCKHQCPHGWERFEKDGQVFCREPCSTYGFDSCPRGELGSCYKDGAGPCSLHKNNWIARPMCEEAAKALGITAWNDEKFPYAVHQWPVNEFDNWRKKWAGAHVEIGLRGHAYGAVAEDWQTCKVRCELEPQCQQVVFDKRWHGCYGMSEMRKDDQDGKGGTNFNWISAQWDKTPRRRLQGSNDIALGSLEPPKFDDKSNGTIDSISGHPANRIHDDGVINGDHAAGTSTVRFTSDVSVPTKAEATETTQMASAASATRVANNITGTTGRALRGLSRGRRYIV